MKIFKTLGAVLLLTSTLIFSACNQKEEWPKILSQKEYELTVASQKLPGVVTSCGNSSKTEVFAVKKANATEWTDLASISDFEYEAGNEYRIRIQETHYLDKRMGEPEWTTYQLLKEYIRKGFVLNDERMKRGSTAFRKYEILPDKGHISAAKAKEKAEQEYAIFNRTQKIESDFRGHVRDMLE